MAQRPIPLISVPPAKGPALPLWFSFDSNEDEKELWQLEQELASELERIEQRHCETVPTGKSGNESYVDDDDEEDEEEEDNDDEESEERDESEDEEMIDDVEDAVDD